jgi:hypothetical protein
MTHHPSKSSEADYISREHLVRLLAEQIELTFASNGRAHALQKIADMLRKLDEAALRALVYQQGLQHEDELSEPASDRAKAEALGELK